jgi:hypothetical protein
MGGLQCGEQTEQARPRPRWRSWNRCECV